MTTQILFHSSAGTMGELIDHIEALDADGRRELLDTARTAAGLDTVEDAEGHRAFEIANRNLRPGRDSEGKIFQGCAERSCHAWPQDELGMPTGVVDRVWWCAKHRHLAGPEDHLPPEPKYRIDPETMSPRPVGAERERLAAEDEKLRQQAAEREQRRRQGAKALNEVRERYIEQAKPIRVAGWLVRPDGRVVDE